MKLCFFSDIHGNDIAYQAFLKSVENKAIDLMICAGDVCGYYYESDKILTSIRKIPGMIYILGNHDKMVLDILDGKKNEKDMIQRYGNSYLDTAHMLSDDNVAFLRSVPLMYLLEADGLKIGFYHGGPADPLNMRIYPDTDIQDSPEYQQYQYIFCGHTHHKMLRKKGKCTIVNPGSVGQQRDGKGTSYAIFDTKERKLEICTFAYDVQALINKVEQKETNAEMKEKLIEVLLRKR